jgi:GH25 family lysozyme M1 (1,4-beta-N-acetylmuramidase)
MIWFDIEGTWSGTQAAHNEFIHGLITEANALGIRWGIYTSESQWGPITGNTAQFGAPPLWYAHYDNNPSFSDFRPFGGWQHPSIKQYEGTVRVCGVEVDKNWY